MRLDVSDLHVRFYTHSEVVHAVNGASFSIEDGEIVGLVGESGCGKSATAQSIVRLEDPGEITRGTVEFDGTDLTTADDITLRRLRGQEIGMVFQEPETALNPTYTIGEQIAEAFRVQCDPLDQPLFQELFASLGSRIRTKQPRDKVIELLDEVGISDPEDRVDDYPHQFSGGMSQRVMLAIALACQPSLLIADEPTTGLDTTTQAEILDRLATLSNRYEMSILLISHDMSVISRLCDRIIVMYDGVIVESGSKNQLLKNPAHPYTKALIGCLPGRSKSDEVLPTIDENPPSESLPSSGCVFVDRCPAARKECENSDPPTVELESEQLVRCGVPEARKTDFKTLYRNSADSMDDTLPASNQRHSVLMAGNHEEQTDPLTEVMTEWSERSASTSLIEVENVTKTFETSDTTLDRMLGSDDQLVAVNDVSLQIQPGETLGLVGESGCGKSTLARIIAGLESPTAGTVKIDGESVGNVSSRRSNQLSEIGFVFQNAKASLNPKRTVKESIAEPLYEIGWDRKRRAERVERLLSLVSLPQEFATRYPDQLSGGQLQRVVIARSLAPEPSVLLLDEPTAGLDVSVQGSILNLLKRLQDKLGLSYLFVSHDLRVAQHVADRIATMYSGQLLEVGPANRMFSEPTHPYTATLLEAVPREHKTANKKMIKKGPTNSAGLPSGCVFYPRCPVSDEECEQVKPAWETVGGINSRCHYAERCTEIETKTNWYEI